MEAGGNGPAIAYGAALAGGLWILHGARRSFWLMSLLALPGTLAHELCHWGLGKLLNGQPVRFTVLPRREGRGYVLGAVSFANLRWYNAFFIGMAPLLMLPAAYALVRWRLAVRPTWGWREALPAFLIANLVFGALPSWQDLRVAARSPVGWTLLAAGGVWAWFWIQTPRAPSVLGALAWRR